MKRSEFIKNISLATVLLADGSIIPALGTESLKTKNKLRFVVASDGHYGQSKTDFQQYFDTIIKEINTQHAQEKFELCVINGDIIHDNPAFLADAKKTLDALEMPYYITQGNHDRVPADLWQQTWNMPFDYDVVVKDNAFLFGTTSNIKGEYLCPNLSWFKQKLEEHKNKKNIFIFIHITPVKWTDNGVDCLDFQTLVKQYKNIRGIFNGHDHDQEGIKTKDGIPYLFDSHIGGSWGTPYRGYRIVELKKNNDILTYLMNPTVRINEAKL
ncbi:metallophosphoesterase family protein [Emticicia sp. 17c]|uniref:metallophosphoesterase family protein n=1 Tax=Emticicia sp. 17c TaxID=3127704 RepID=UPI00301CDEEB